MFTVSSLNSSINPRKATYQSAPALAATAAPTGDTGERPQLQQLLRTRFHEAKDAPDRVEVVRVHLDLTRDRSGMIGVIRQVLRQEINEYAPTGIVGDDDS